MASPMAVSRPASPMTDSPSMDRHGLAVEGQRGLQIGRVPNRISPSRSPWRRSMKRPATALTTSRRVTGRAVDLIVAGLHRAGDVHRQHQVAAGDRQAHRVPQPLGAGRGQHQQHPGQQGHQAPGPPPHRPAQAAPAAPAEGQPQGAARRRTRRRRQQPARQERQRQGGEHPGPGQGDHVRPRALRTIQPAPGRRAPSRGRSRPPAGRSLARAGPGPRCGRPSRPRGVEEGEPGLPVSPATSRRGKRARAKRRSSRERPGRRRTRPRPAPAAGLSSASSRRAARAGAPSRWRRTSQRTPQGQGQDQPQGQQPPAGGRRPPGDRLRQVPGPKPRQGIGGTVERGVGSAPVMGWHLGSGHRRAPARPGPGWDPPDPWSPGSAGAPDGDVPAFQDLQPGREAAVITLPATGPRQVQDTAAPAV
jgi:hypothetical protein